MTVLTILDYTRRLHHGCCSCHLRLHELFGQSTACIHDEVMPTYTQLFIRYCPQPVFLDPVSFPGTASHTNERQSKEHEHWLAGAQAAAHP
jgi:hypothetical protein